MKTAEKTPTEKREKKAKKKKEKKEKKEKKAKDKKKIRDMNKTRDLKMLGLIIFSEHLEIYINITYYFFWVPSRPRPHCLISLTSSASVWPSSFSFLNLHRAVAILASSSLSF